MHPHQGKSLRSHTVRWSLRARADGHSWPDQTSLHCWKLGQSLALRGYSTCLLYSWRKMDLQVWNTSVHQRHSTGETALHCVTRRPRMLLPSDCSTVPKGTDHSSGWRSWVTAHSVSASEMWRAGDFSFFKANDMKAAYTAFLHIL